MSFSDAIYTAAEQTSTLLWSSEFASRDDQQQPVSAVVGAFMAIAASLIRAHGPKQTVVEEEEEEEEEVVSLEDLIGMWRQLKETLTSDRCHPKWWLLTAFFDSCIEFKVKEVELRAFAWGRDHIGVGWSENTKEPFVVCWARETSSDASVLVFDVGERTVRQDKLETAEAKWAGKITQVLLCPCDSWNHSSFTMECRRSIVKAVLPSIDEKKSRALAIKKKHGDFFSAVMKHCEQAHSFPLFFISKVVSSSSPKMRNTSFAALGAPLSPSSTRMPSPSNLSLTVLDSDIVEKGSATFAISKEHDRPQVSFLLAAERTARQCAEMFLRSMLAFGQLATVGPDFSTAKFIVSALRSESESTLPSLVTLLKVTGCSWEEVGVLIDFAGSTGGVIFTAANLAETGALVWTTAERRGDETGIIEFVGCTARDGGFMSEMRPCQNRYQCSLPAFVKAETCDVEIVLPRKE